MMYDWNAWAWWWMAVMMLLMVAVVGLVAWAVARALQRPSSARETAEAVLLQRFATGEIDADEYHARLATLREHTPA